MSGLLPMADGGGSPPDQGISTLLLVGAVLFGLVGVQRLRGRGFRHLPRAGGYAAGLLALACVSLALVLPPIVRPDAGPLRPSSPARISILSPAPGQVFRGRPAEIPVRVRLVGGRIVPFTSTRLSPDQGHLHLYLDGVLASMSLSTSQELPVGPGTHRLVVEFVATDHAPFRPPVRAAVSFRVVGS